jgi:DNA-binding NarL/FixJ family response regulator
MLRILVADAYEVVRLGVKRLVASHPGWELTAQAGDGREALDLVLQNKPDVAVIEVSLPSVGGVALARRLRQEATDTSVLLHTTHDDDATITAGLAAGVRGYVLKADGAQHLEAAISALAARRPYFSPGVSEFLLDVAAHGREGRQLMRFTGREQEVAQLVAEGNGNKDIARLLGISVKTVETHRLAAMRKAGTRTSADLVRFAIKHNLILA